MVFRFAHPPKHEDIQAQHVKVGMRVKLGDQTLQVLVVGTSKKFNGMTELIFGPYRHAPRSQQKYLLVPNRHLLTLVTR